MIGLPKKGEPVLVQGITGRYGSLHATLMRSYGTNIVGGVTPGKGGEEAAGVPVYDTVREAVDATGAAVSVVFVPAPRFLAAFEEAVSAGMKTVVAITEHIPIRDELKMVDLSLKQGTFVLGPNTPGMIIPSEGVKLGIMPPQPFSVGRVALVSRSGTLMYEIANQLSAENLGQSVALGIGGDPINGTTAEECLDALLSDDSTDAVVVIGEIGGDSEERLASHIAKMGPKKPIFAYVAGRSAPREKRMGHAGAIIYGDYGTAESKMSAFRNAGVAVAKTPSELPALVAKGLKR